MTMWVEDELRRVNLGDKRLNKRLIEIVSNLSSNPQASIPQACDGEWKSTKATYNFWNNKRVKAEDILAGHIAICRERCEEHQTILSLQDTTDFDLTKHPKTEGLGYLENRYLQGLKCHSVLATSEKGVPLGLIYQETWARDNSQFGKKNQRKQKKTSEKESQRWLSSLSVTENVLDEIPRVVTIADREADIYDLFAMPRQKGHELLIRCVQNRCVTHQKAKKLHQAVKSQPIKGTFKLDLGRRSNKPARSATLAIRYTKVDIHPPQSRAKKEQLKPISMQVLLAEEIKPPANEEAIRWLLLTTLPLDCFEQALQYLQWYSYRWLIERYHFVLKSGCGLEDLQLKTAERLKRAFATYCMVAWRLLWLTYEARQSPENSCETALESPEWQALYAVTHHTMDIPTQIPSFSQAIGWIAKLGGFLGRKRDGDPGVKTLWQGLARLHDLTSLWQLFQSFCHT